MRAAASSSAARSSGADAGVGGVDLGGGEGEGRGGELQPVPARGHLDDRGVAARRHVGEDRGDLGVDLRVGLALLRQERGEARLEVRVAGVEELRHPALTSGGEA